jgi:hypothetical protein
MKRLEVEHVTSDTESSSPSEEKLAQKFYRGLRIWSRPDPKYLIRAGGGEGGHGGPPGGPPGGPARPPDKDQGKRTDRQPKKQPKSGPAQKPPKKRKNRS